MRQRNACSHHWLQTHLVAEQLAQGLVLLLALALLAARRLERAARGLGVELDGLARRLDALVARALLLAQAVVQALRLLGRQLAAVARQRRRVPAGVVDLLGRKHRRGRRRRRQRTLEGDGGRVRDRLDRRLGLQSGRGASVRGAAAQRSSQ